MVSFTSCRPHNVPKELFQERRIRDHARSIHALQYSPPLQSYCITGSADGDIRIWVRILVLVPNIIPDRSRAGHTGPDEIDYEDTPRGSCSSGCILAYILTIQTCRRGAGRWEHTQVRAMSFSFPTIF